MPGQPLIGDLHVNRPLSNISVAYRSQGSFVHSTVFPVIRVQNQSDQFWRYPKGVFYRQDVEPRSPGAETAETGWEVELDAYYTPVYGLHVDIPDMTRANADSVFSLDRDATEILTGQMQRKREAIWISRFFKTGVWGEDRTGVASGPTGTQFLRWDNDSSDPVEQVEQWRVAKQESTGLSYNTLVIGPYVMSALKNHPALIDRIKYTQRGMLTEELISSMLGVRVVVADSIQATTLAEPGVFATPTLGFMFGKAGLFCYTASSPSLMTPTAGYQFEWTGYTGASGGSRIKKFRIEPNASDRIEIEAAFDMRIICADLGMFLSTMVS